MVPPTRADHDVLRASGSPVLEMIGVTRTIDGRNIVDDISWTVREGEHWAVLGANGSGKTTLARMASLRLHPSAGRLRVLGNELGLIDIRPLLPLVGYTAAALADQLRPDIAVRDVVMTAKNGALEPWWHKYDEADHEKALQSLERVGVGSLSGQRFGSCSSGEKQRVLIARALMTGPELLIMDEPTAALDLGGREDFVAALDAIAATPDASPMVLITHHVDEIPASFTHVLLMANGKELLAGPIEETLTAANLSSAFGVELMLERRNGRWWAWGERSS